MSDLNKQDELQPYNICRGCGADYSAQLGWDVCPKCGRQVQLILSKPSQLPQKLAEAGIHNYLGLTSQEKQPGSRMLPL